MKALVLNRIALILACAGMYVSGVLSLGSLLSISVPCGASRGCDTVAQHPSSHLLGVPNSYVGFVLYAVVAVLCVWRLAAPTSRPAVTIGFGLTGVATLVSLYLTYVSVAVIGATCYWCLASTGITVLLFFLHAMLMSAVALERDSRITVDAALCVCLVLGLSIGLTVQAQLMISSSTQGARIMPGVANAEVLPPDAHFLGNPNAQLAIVEFADLLCPSCREQFPHLRDYVGLHPGKVKYVFRHYPMYNLTGHEEAAPAAVVAEIAAEKGKFWDFVAAIYAKPEEELSTIDEVLEIAVAVGLDRDKTLSRIQDKNDPAFKRVMADISAASGLGVHQTPTFFIVAAGLKVRAATANTLDDDLARPEYSRFLNGK